MAKCGILCPKTPLLTEKQPHAIHFFVATRNVCPLAIPESCAQNMGLRLLENHSFRLLVISQDIVGLQSVAQHLRWWKRVEDRMVGKYANFHYLSLLTVD